MLKHLFLLFLVRFSSELLVSLIYKNIRKNNVKLHGLVGFIYNDGVN